MADEATNQASAPTVDQAASQETAQATVADNAVAGEQSQTSESVAPTHEEVALSDRAAMLFEELVRHIKSEETALVGSVDAILSDIVATVRG